ncbi:MAG: FUN14 domain-containing protein [Planctomycetota bacterium]
MGEKESAKGGAGGRKGLAALPEWKKALLGVAVVLILVGLGLKGYGIVTGSRSVSVSSSAAPSGGNGLAGDGRTSPLLPETESGQETGGIAGSSESGEGAGSWSPLFLKLGFSFFAGFALGFALRFFFKITLLAAGLILLALYGLSQAGIIQVDWNALEQLYDSSVAWISGQAGTLKEFLTGNLPAAGSAGFGLLVGFKKG